MSILPDSRARPSADRRSAFTLTELLTVLAVMAILAAILLPVVFRMQDRALEVESINRLRELGAATRLFANDHGGQLPTNGSTNPFEGAGYGRYFYLIGPYIAPQIADSAAALRASKLFNCPTLDDVENLGQQHHYAYNMMVGMRNAAGTGFNNRLPTPLRLAAVPDPDNAPIQWSVSGEFGGADPYVPTPAAAGYGWTGPTDPGGLSPNHGSRCIVLYISGRVEAVDLSSVENPPYEGEFPRGRWPIGSAFDPTHP